MTNTHASPSLDRLITWSLNTRLSAPLRYAIATVLVIAVGLFRAFAIAEIVPWLLFVPVVLAVALMLGRSVGLYAGVLAMIVAALSIGSADQPLWLNQAQWTGSILFLLVATGIALFAAQLRAAFARAHLLAAEKNTANAILAEREAFLASVLASSTDCIKVLDLDARITYMSEGGQKIMEVSDFNQIKGCPWPDFWQDQGNAEAKAAIAAAKAGHSHNFVGRAATMAGTVKWWDVAVSPVMGRDGRPERILSVSRDITASRANAETRGHLARIVENSADFIGMSRLDGRVFFLNDAARRLLGIEQHEVATTRIDDFFPPDEAAGVREEVLRIADTKGSWTGERLFRHFRSGALIPVLYTVFPVADSDGTPLGYGTVTRDLRERKQAEEQQILLNNELSHRLKNVLAVVQSIASQTLRRAADLPSANEALAARLLALGQATDVLTAKSWLSADLRQVVERTLAPHGGIGERIRISGPSITLVPQVTLAFALALHELATNAAKYGALSNPFGHVELSWSVAAAGDDQALQFHLTWQEFGGPPVSPPTRRGFGSTLIERSLGSYFHGPARLDFLPGGLVFTLEAPLGNAGTVGE